MIKLNLFLQITSENEVTALREELEIAQKSLKYQTKRCRELVEEYTKRLQEKEKQYQSEKLLRDNQLAKVLRALLIFEARLRQEQKLITHQLEEKDYIIRKQKSDMHKILSNQYCKHCNQYYVTNLEALDSSSEYVDYFDYQSSNVESLDSSCETYATVSDYDQKLPESGDEIKSESVKTSFTKNKNSLVKRNRKIPHRKSVGTYFEVLKLRNDNISLSSNEESSDNIEKTYDELKFLLVTSSSNQSESDCNDTVIQKITTENDMEPNETLDANAKIKEHIPSIFEGDGGNNDSWYVNAGSDQEDDQQRIYRNNPVLECMNQILLQNMNGVNSPPKTPTLERRSLKNKRVKFREEEQSDTKYENKEVEYLTTEENDQNNYYETPVQKVPNFYETPQSIYSNDYEQILSESMSSENGAINAIEKVLNTNYETPKDHHYIDMDITTPEEENKIKRKVKIHRIPPALPPKPANLVSKYKLQHIPNKFPKIEKAMDIESEPDYCSISELNLPNKNAVLNKINVISEINVHNLNETNVSDKTIILHQPKEDIKESTYDPLDINDCISNLVKKNVEKFNIQLAKQTPVKTETLNEKPKLKKQELDIPKLPQVSEIIIPEEAETKKEDRIAQDNYVKNNSQVLKSARKPIAIGTSVSTLITGFNNHQVLSEIKPKPKTTNKKMLLSFDSEQNFDKHAKNTSQTLNFENFDLSQNFEEFKLDDCDIGEEYKLDLPDVVTDIKEEPKLEQEPKNYSTRVEVIRATIDSVDQLKTSSVEQLKRKLEAQKNNDSKTKPYTTEPTYEDFLECTGLSSKSILTPINKLKTHTSTLPSNVKLRPKLRNNVLDKYGGSIKYWSEPYL